MTVRATDRDTGWWVEARTAMPEDPVEYRTQDSPTWTRAPTGQQSSSYRCRDSEELAVAAVGWATEGGGYAVHYDDDGDLQLDEPDQWDISWPDDEDEEYDEEE